MLLPTPFAETVPCLLSPFPGSLLLPSSSPITSPQHLTSPVFPYSLPPFTHLPVENARNVAMECLHIVKISIENEDPVTAQVLTHGKQSGMSRKTLTASKHPKPSLQYSAVRAFPQKLAFLIKDMKSSNICVSRQSQEELGPRKYLCS